MDASPTLETIAAQFRHFAEKEVRNYSPLYERFCIGIAEDKPLLELIAHVPANQLYPNMIFAAVQYLLLKGIADPLAAFYPSLNANGGADAAPATDPYPYFRAFCLAHYDEILVLLKTRRVQTNEVGRSAYLLPIFTLIAQRTAYRPLALVDVGCSAGLNLLWDKYSYDYGDGNIYGDPASAVRLSCELRGDLRPPLPTHLPAVVQRVGLDINPIDVHDPDAALWLRALVWPEHQQRINALTAAISIAQTQAQPLTLLAGDALDLLPEVITNTPADAILCLFHTFSLYQFSHSALERLSGIIKEAAQTRPLYWFGAEWTPNSPQITLSAFADGDGEPHVIARCPPHGQWLEWLG